MSIRCEECIDCNDLVRDTDVEVCDDCHGFICPQCINSYKDEETGDILNLCIACYEKRLKEERNK